jgi:hypothetical protein
MIVHIARFLFSFLLYIGFTYSPRTIDLGEGRKWPLFFLPFSMSSQKLLGLNTALFITRIVVYRRKKSLTNRTIYFPISAGRFSFNNDSPLSSPPSTSAISLSSS